MEQEMYVARDKTNNLYLYISNAPEKVNMEKKYKLTDETINVYGRTLHRIEALKDFGDVKKGDKGGFIEKEDNLSQSDNCWVYGNAKVFGNANVYGNAKVYDSAEVFSNAKVYDSAEVCGDARICADAKVESNGDYIVFKNWWSSGRYFTWTRSNNMWKVGCFFGTGEELIAKAYKDSELSGREYERVVRYVKSILNEDRI